MNLETRLNHPVKVKLHPGNEPVLSPIYHSVKFVLSDKFPFGEQFAYTRASNPTTRQLELTLAAAQRREDCIIVSSGIAAITGTFLSILKQGDHIITFREIYRPTRIFIKDILPRYGIDCSILKLNEAESLKNAIVPGKTKLIHFESPTNPNLDIAEINSLIKIARDNGLMVSMDGTFAGLHQHTEFDVDFMLHSLTKYGNGHGDVMAGSISGKSELIKAVREMCTYLGPTLDPLASNLIIRGLKTYMLRYQRQCQSALAIAEYLFKHPKIKAVRYPGLEIHPQYELAKSQMKDMGGVVSFEIDPTVAESAEAFCRRLNLIQMAGSLGSTETLISPTLMFFGMDLSESDRNEMGLNNYSLRLSVGLEDVQDLIDDLEIVLVEKYS